tara:strand:- start:9273 stop:9569 length:297 start_codon:yes stop_codon:yes gene_type:complete
MLSILAETDLSVPVGWVLASGATLSGAISYLARLIYNSQQAQIDILREEIREMRKINEARSAIIVGQNETIIALQDDIRDLKRGCYAEGCRWLQTAPL